MVDKNGANPKYIRYKPYGAVQQADDPDITKYQYTGQENDFDTGLYYYNARYYDPDLCRFIQADTVLDGLNRYTYCSNNPIIYIDPTGHADILTRPIVHENFLWTLADIVADHWLVTYPYFDKNAVVQFYKGGISKYEGVRNETYTIQFSNMDDILTGKAIDQVIASGKFTADTYKIVSNDCKDFALAVKEAYKQLWIDQQKQLHKDDKDFDIDKAWKEHEKEITKEKGKKVEYKNLNTNEKVEGAEESGDKDDDSDGDDE